MACLLDHRDSQAIVQVLLGPDADSVLVRTESATRLIGLSGETLAETATPTGTWWVRHPSKGSRLIAIQADKLHVFDWAQSKRNSSVRGTRLVNPGGSLLEANTPWIGDSSSGYFAQIIPGPEFRFADVVTFEASEVSIQTQEVILRVLRARSMHIHLLLDF